ncbi:hypothetical protein ACN28S_10935 [Cystobacter fuscus]
MSGSYGVSEFDYGQCPCNGNYEHRLIEVDVVVEQRNVVLTNIPQGECPCVALRSTRCRSWSASRP